MSAISHEERVEYRAWVRNGLEKVAPLSRTRLMLEAQDRADRQLWDDLVALDVLGLAVGEASGGSDLPPSALEILLEEAGRCLLPAPLLAGSVLLPLAVRWRGVEAQFSELLADVAAGRVRVGLAVPRRGKQQPVTAVRAGPMWSLEGDLPVVVDGDLADELLVAADVDGVAGLFVVGSSRGGVRNAAGAALDLTRPVVSAHLSGATGVPVGEIPDGGQLVSSVLDLLRIALAAELVGTSRKLLEMSVEYAGVRSQFGRPIGEFQSIKHRCADVFVAVEAAAAAVEAAFDGLDDGTAPRSAAAAVAAVFSQDAAWLALRAAMQIHGGLSLTWEHEVHWYVKRATASAHLLGNPDRELSRLADLVLADEFDVVRELIGD